MSHRNRDGSHVTQRERWQHLQLFARQLKSLGYRQLAAKSLRTKHVQKLLHHWRSEIGARGRPITDETIKNRMAHLRWWAEKIKKQNIIPRDNEELGIIVDRTPHSKKAKELEPHKLKQIQSPHIVMSLKLQRAFGLRREEAMKFRPVDADHGNHIRLKPSWCKGGRGRVVPVDSQTQRLLLDEAKAMVGTQSLIPRDTSYKTHLKKWEFETHRVGIGNTHGLRHQYAIETYQNLTGLLAPIAGGPGRRSLTPEQRVLDVLARKAIARQLGHSRLSITNVYLGR